MTISFSHPRRAGCRPLSAVLEILFLDTHIFHVFGCITIGFPVLFGEGLTELFQACAIHPPEKTI
jgi:hypothetical protein